MHWGFQNIPIQFRFWIYLPFLLVFLLVSDTLIKDAPFFDRSYWALYDGFVHGFTGVIILSVRLPKVKWYDVVLFFAMSSVVDIDHFIAAGSFSVEAAISLTMRPITHSLTFAALLATITFLITKRNKTTAWIIFAALASHVIRDAYSGVTPLLWPMELYQIPYGLYLVLEVVLLRTTWKIGTWEIEPN